MLSHQGGWDEILTVLLPLTLIATTIWFIARRVAGTDHDAGPEDQMPGVGDE